MTIKDVLVYYDITRGVGHTDTIMKSMKANPKAKLLIWNRQQAMSLGQRYDLKMDRFISIQDNSSVFIGKIFPLLIDHYAFKQLILNSDGDLFKEQERYKKLISKLEKEIRRLKRYEKGFNPLKEI